MQHDWENLEGIPWDRMVHFYGRASKIPVIVRWLASGGMMDEDMRMELVCLEHQDGVTFATPFAAFHLLRILPDVRDRAGLLQILKTCRDAARFQRDGWRDVGLPFDLDELLSPAYLWPPFVGEGEDEIFWEVWDPPNFNLAQYSWAYHTAHVLDALPGE